MSQYVLYDPERQLDKVFSLDHVCEKNADKMLAREEEVVLVEDSHLDALLNANKGHITAVFVTTKSSAADFRKLKQIARFVLQTPVEKEEVEALVEVLRGNMLESELDMSGELPPELLQKYEDGVFDQIEGMERLIYAIRDSPPNRENLEALRNSVHKFAGTAVSYGYVATTPLCRAHEAYLESCYDSLPKESIVKASLIFFRRFRLTMQKLNLI